MGRGTGFVGMNGNLGVKVRRQPPMWRRKLKEFFAGAPAEPAWKKDATMAARSTLYAKVMRGNGVEEDLGMIANKKVTYEFVNHLVQTLIGSDPATFQDYKYHTSGTNNAAEDNSHTGATFTSPDAMVTGTQTDGSTTNIYQTVATINYSATKTVVEHGVVNVATIGGLGETLMDRSQFAAIVVNDGDSIEFTYELTVNAEA